MCRNYTRKERNETNRNIGRRPFSPLCFFPLLSFSSESPEGSTPPPASPQRERTEVRAADRVIVHIVHKCCDLLLPPPAHHLPLPAFIPPVPCGCCCREKPRLKTTCFRPRLDSSLSHKWPRHTDKPGKGKQTGRGLHERKGVQARLAALTRLAVHIRVSPLRALPSLPSLPGSQKKKEERYAADPKIVFCKRNQQTGSKQNKVTRNTANSTGTQSSDAKKYARRQGRSCAVLHLFPNPPCPIGGSVV